MLLFARTDQSHFGRWWWTVDRWLLGALFILMMFGTFLITTAGPAIADQYSYDNPNYFIIRHLVMLIPSIGLMLAISLLSPRYVRLLAMFGLAASIFAMMLIPFIGAEVKGGQRWFRILGFSLQPSEFMKPCFIVLTAWLFAHPAIRGRFVMKAVPVLSLVLVISLLIIQPDVGMSAVVGLVWLGQLFLAGLPLPLVVLMTLAGISLLGGAYLFLPHFTSRIDRFLDPSSGDTYQIDRATEAFASGGLFGTGPGQGVVKNVLPDAHSDFIFAVAGEELGLIWCLVLIALIAFIFLRGLYRSGQGETLFVTLASAGLIMQFGLQSFINIASALHVIPTKGMTLPFISYGGSSLLAMGLAMGMLLALTRRRTGARR